MPLVLQDTEGQLSDQFSIKSISKQRLLINTFNTRPNHNYVKVLSIYLIYI